MFVYSPVNADPATLNRDRTGGTDKAIGIIACKDLYYYIVKTAVGQMSNAQFIDRLFDFYIY